MTPESIQGLSIPRELVLSVLRGGERVEEARRLRVLAALAAAEPRRERDALGATRLHERDARNAGEQPAHDGLGEAA